jgi:hypothetical protein
MHLYDLQYNSWHKTHSTLRLAAAWATWRRTHPLTQYPVIKRISQTRLQTANPSTQCTYIRQWMWGDSLSFHASRSGTSTGGTRRSRAGAAEASNTSRPVHNPSVCWQFGTEFRNITITGSTNTTSGSVWEENYSALKPLCPAKTLEPMAQPHGMCQYKCLVITSDMFSFYTTANHNMAKNFSLFASNGFSSLTNKSSRIAALRCSL